MAREAVSAPLGHGLIEMYNSYIDVLEHRIRDAFKMLTGCLQ